jgi:uncharacterized membrane protein
MMNGRLGALVFLFVGGLAACGGSVAEPQSAQGDTGSTTQAIVAAPEHGPLKILALGLSKVALKPGQRAEIEKMFADANARHDKAKADGKSARDELLAALATQVEQGKVDRAALAPKLDAQAKLWQTSRDADRAALERLHDLLEPAQRIALVDAISQEHADAPRKHRRNLDDPGASAGAAGADDEEMKHHAKRGMRMHKFGADLKLTDEQKSKLADAMRADRMKMAPEHGAAAHGRLKAVFEAFKTDHFKLDEVAPKTELHLPLDRAVHFAETALPILTAEQRTTLAGKLRDKSKSDE